MDRSKTNNDQHVKFLPCETRKYRNAYPPVGYLRLFLFLVLLARENDPRTVLTRSRSNLFVCHWLTRTVLFVPLCVLKKGDRGVARPPAHHKEPKCFLLCSKLSILLRLTLARPSKSKFQKIPPKMEPDCSV